MSILPSGSRKILHAQTSPVHQMGLGGDLPPDDQMRDFGEGHEDVPVDRASEGDEMVNEVKPTDVNQSDESDMLGWIMKLMYELGYQINEDLAKYAQEFVKESMFTGPDGQIGERRVVVTIPDRYGKAYKGGFLSGDGVKKRLSNEHITKVVTTLREKFGLFPVSGGGKEGAPILREDGKLIINLSSSRPKPVLDEAEIGDEPTTELDEVFGNGAGTPPTKKKPSARAASTLREMMKEAKNNLIAGYWDRPLSYDERAGWYDGDTDRGAGDEGYAKDEPSHKQALYFQRLLEKAEALGFRWNGSRDGYTYSRGEISELINYLKSEINTLKL